MDDPATPKQALSEAMAAESIQAAAVAAEAKDKAQRALIAEAVEAGMKVNEPRIVALEEWRDKHDDLVKNLATKDDIKEIVNVFGNIKIAAAALSAGGKYGYKTLLIVAGIIGALAVIIGGIKAGLVGILAWAITPTP